MFSIRRFVGLTSVALCISLLPGYCLLSQESRTNFLRGPTPRADPMQRSPVEGFAWPTSVLPGDSIRFYVSVMALVADGKRDSAFEVQFYRVPNIDKNALMRPDTLRGQFFSLRDSCNKPITQEDSCDGPVDYKLGCREYWAPGSFAFAVPVGWPSGLYAVRLIHLSMPAWDQMYYIPFVVRAEDPGKETKILFKFDITTWQAYNWWGGGSLYSASQGPKLAPTDTIAMDRPLTIAQSQAIRYMANAFVQTLLDSAYTMEYCDNTDLDTREDDFDGSMLPHYNLLVLWSHDEYWSTNERANTRLFIGRESRYTRNIARFAPNTCYWRIHWEGGPGGEHRRLACVKKGDADMWRKLGLHEAEFLGSEYQTGWNNWTEDPFTDEPPAKVYNEKHWIFRETGLEKGQFFGLGAKKDTCAQHVGIVSGELDNTLTYRLNYPLDTLAQAFVTSRVDSGTVWKGYAPVLHQMVYYEDTVSNSRVFAQGAGGWYLGLADDANVECDKERMRRITMNIMSHFSGNKYLGKVHSNTTHPLVWQDSVEIDGDTYVGDTKYLKMSSTNVVIDSGVTFFIDGRLDVEGTDSIFGSGQINLWHKGKINLLPGATLWIGPGVVLDIEDSGDVAFGTGTRLEIEGTILALTRSNLTVEGGGVLEMHAGAQAYFGAYAQITCQGRMECSGTENKPVIFSAVEQSPPPGAWYGIVLNAGPNTLRHCLIQYATDGIDVKNTSVNLIDSCTISDCSTNGILGSMTAPSDSALRIWSTTLSRNARGLALSSARADVDRCLITANRWQGVYQPTSVCYITNTRIEENGYAGIMVSGASSEVILGTPDHGPGYVTVYNNNAAHGTSNDEISLLSGGTATIGFDDDELKHWGYNNIYRGPNASRYLVANNSVPIVMAHLTYWGPDGPQPGDFLGSVDYSYWLTSPAKETGKAIENRQNMQPGNETANAERFVSRLMGMVERGTDSSFFALHALATMVGPGGKSAKLLPQGWEAYLQETGSAAREKWLQDLCHAFRLQARLSRRDFPGTIAYADSLLVTNPPDNLWLLCELDKINALVGMGKKDEGVQLLGAIQERGRRIDADAIELTDEILKGR